MSSGRYLRFWQSCKSKLWRPVRYLIDEGNSRIPLWRKYKVLKHFISGWILGNFSSLKQSIRTKSTRDFNLRVFGRIWSFSQPWRSHIWSLSRNPTDSWTLTKFWQKERSNSSRLGIHNLGNSVIDSHLLRLIYFKYFSWIPCWRKKIKNKIYFQPTFK